ncbi:MAG: hypothetical protein PVH19_14750 [Planctomycetia bacterium]|jgi:hypothetical protein
MAKPKRIDHRKPRILDGKLLLEQLDFTPQPIILRPEVETGEVETGTQQSNPHSGYVASPEPI